MSLLVEYTPPLRLDYTAPKTTIYSIGYEGLTIEGFIRRLRDNNIKRIIDVRKNPLSRKPGFSKKPLESFLCESNIEYRHFPELGIPSSMRQSLKTKDDYKKLFDQYEEEILPYQQATIDEVIKLIEEKPSALMCFEAKPLDCHRTRLSMVIERITHFDHLYICKK